MAAPSEDHDQKPITMVRPLHSARGSTRPRCQIVRCLSPRPRTSTLGQSLPSPLPSWRQRRSPTHLPPPAALRSPPTSPPQSSPPTRQSNTSFTESEVRRVVQCISSAVSYLHSKDIVHRDLKMENLLVAVNPKDVNDKLYIKVTDFGLSVVRGGIGQENMLQEMCGTPAYMAPELFGSRMYSQQCDIWAMGVIMYILLTGKFPFEPHGNRTLPMVVANDEPDMSGPAFKGDEKEPLKKLLRKMLEKNPAYRANARDVETDPWTRNAQEEAPSENVMELMRMWRKDMRSPSLGDAEDFATNAIVPKETCS